MNLRKHARYRLRVRDDLSYEVIAPDGTPHFVFPATRPCPKLYMVGSSRGLHYVGVTNSSMAARLNFGLKATGAHGYHGYAWKSLRIPLTLDIWCADAGCSKRGIEALEAVEAEVVYLWRRHTGHWPLSQTEIHFRPPSKSHRDLALKVFRDFRRNTPHA